MKLHVYDPRVKRIVLSERQIRLLRHVAKKEPLGVELAGMSLNTVYSLIRRGYIRPHVNKWKPSSLGFDVLGRFTSDNSRTLKVKRPVQRHHIGAVRQEVRRAS